ncbi:MAG TPA: DUF1565 domain-containing protein, partial [Candidatus Cloacimonadota bacterium]|nr:DUF1565 domain-containing protein [Candidatus Cloacimonadota bacterium]
MKKIVFLLLVLLSSTIYANILEVGNTGQAFTSIQLAIHTAVSGDTILIHPGRYYENLTVGSKTLTLSSLYLFSQDETDINNTIIDGNQQGQGLYMFNSHNSAVIGLTFEHGIGSLQGFGLRGGGAILARNSQNLILKANIVQYNRSFSSGGIALTDCSTFISGNVIRFNSANFVGGLSVAFVDTVDNGSAIVFDNVHKNSIYSNAGGLTNDLSLYNTTSVNALHLDIASYAFYSKYYIKVLNTAEENIGLSDFTAEQSFFQPVIQDLYVSINGDDSNSGLSMNEPLRNIYTALSRIQGNIESPVTIFIEPGVYSPLEGEELFPLLLKDGVHFKGYNGRFTIDCLNQSSVFDGRSIENVLIQDLNIDNPGTQFLENENIFYLDKGNHVTFKNISVSVSLDKILFIFNHMWIKDLVMQNIEVNAPRGSSHIFLGQLTTPSRQENILINGGKRAMSYGITSYEPETLPVSISNVGIFNVSDMSQVLWGFPYMGCAFLYNNYANEDTYPIQKNYFSNFTVSNCTGYYGPVHLSQKSKVNFYNSIFYNNQPNIIGVI